MSATAACRAGSKNSADIRRASASAPSSASVATRLEHSAKPSTIHCPPVPGASQPPDTVPPHQLCASVRSRGNETVTSALKQLCASSGYQNDSTPSSTCCEFIVLDAPVPTRLVVALPSYSMVSWIDSSLPTGVPVSITTSSES